MKFQRKSPGKMESRHLIIGLALLLVFAQLVLASDAIIAFKDGDGAGCGGSATQCPYLRFWNSSGSGSWSTESVLPTTGNNLRWMVLKKSPVSEKMVLVTVSDSDYNLDAFVCMANCSNVSNWQVTNNIAAVADVAQRQFDVEFETTTGNALVVYGVLSTNASRDLGYKILPNSSRNFTGITEQYINNAESGSDLQYTWVELDRKPVAGSNELLLAAFDSTDNRIHAWVWNGASWGSQTNISTSATATGGYEALAAKYATDGSKGMVIGANSTIGNVNGKYWNGASWTTADIGVVTIGNNDVK